MNDLPDIPVTALRRLAQGLLYDRHAAEDVVQEAWLAALRANPPATRLGAWMTEAVKRLARNVRRETARRQRRETSVVRAEAQPGGDAHLMQLEVLRKLLDALQALEQPYRAAVMLRFLEGLSMHEVARRLGLPVNTARTHVRRGLERLRRDLDGPRGQGREEFLAGLGSFAGPIPWRLAPKPLVSLAAAVVLVATLWSLRRAPTQDESEAHLEPVASAKDPPARAVESRLSTEVNTRKPASDDAQALGAAWTVRGHVTRGGVEPYPGVPVVGRVHSGFGLGGPVIVEDRCTTDAHGDFEWSVAPPGESVTVWVRPDLADHQIHAT